MQHLKISLSLLVQADFILPEHEQYSPLPSVAQCLKPQQIRFPAAF
jgi:hypothetical protein